MKLDSEPAIRMSLPDPSEGLLRQLTYVLVHSMERNLEEKNFRRALNDVHDILTEALKVPYACMDDSFKLLKDYINRELPAPIVLQYPVCPRCIAADLNHNERNP